MSSITFTDVHKRYGRQHILKGINLHIPAGTTIAILGQSGSGKTTLMRCINFLETIQAGAIAVGKTTILPGRLEEEGTRLSKASMARFRARCGMVFQGFHLFPHMTVLQNLIEAPTGILGKARDQAISDARDILVQIGLAEKEAAFPAALSGGQQQRVAIARALMMSPEVLLFDEPTSALDPVTTSEVLSVIRKLADGQRTVVIVTHELEFARRVSTHVAFMNEGIVEEYRPTEEFFASPRSAAARNFLESFAH